MLVVTAGGWVCTENSTQPIARVSMLTDLDRVRALYDAILLISRTMPLSGFQLRPIKIGNRDQRNGAVG